MTGLQLHYDGSSLGELSLDLFTEFRVVTRVTTGRKPPVLYARLQTVDGEVGVYLKDVGRRLTARYDQAIIDSIKPYLGCLAMGTHTLEVALEAQPPLEPPYSQWHDNLGNGRGYLVESTAPRLYNLYRSRHLDFGVEEPTLADRWRHQPVATRQQDLTDVEYWDLYLSTSLRWLLRATDTTTRNFLSVQVNGEPRVLSVDEMTIGAASCHVRGEDLQSLTPRDLSHYVEILISSGRFSSRLDLAASVEAAIALTQSNRATTAKSSFNFALERLGELRSSI